MIRFIKFLILLIIVVGLFSSCQKNVNCASAISELLEKGCDPKQLSKIMGIPERVIRQPESHTFSEVDSVFLFSLVQTFNETGKLPDNLYQLYNKNKQSQLLQVIENFRQEEIKSNQVFISNLSGDIIAIQKKNLDDFIEEEINSFKSLRFIWISQDEINQVLNKAIPDYLNEFKIAKIYNDSCASYVNYIIRFRENGVKRYLKSNSPQVKLHSINTDIRGFLPQYQFENSTSHVTYQLLATIERAQDILFSPINWVLEILPTWLMITISIILLVILVITIVTHQLHLTILDGILFLISIIMIIWGDPYSETRDAMNDQIQNFYENKINDELVHLNNETNKYYDSLIQSLNINSNRSTSTRSSGLQTGNKTTYERSIRTDFEKNNEGNNRTRGKVDSESITETDNSERDQSFISEGD